MINKLIDLGSIPLVNNLKDTPIESFTSQRYPLSIVYEDDLVMKLSHAADASEMFENYLYRSAVNKPYEEHCKSMFDYVYPYIQDTAESGKLNAVDIGGNDGTLLKCFKKKFTEKGIQNTKFTNVDPSQTFVEDNKKDGINYLQVFWGYEVLKEKANLITSTNVFQHNSNVELFLKGIQNNLDGIWVLEFPYFLRTIQLNQFDQIYHEHYYYWLVTPLVNLFKKYGLTIVSITEHDIHGGSIRIISTNKEIEQSPEVDRFIEEEKNFDFIDWSKEVTKKIGRDNQILKQVAQVGKIACFGAAAKGCVYLNCLDRDLVGSNILYVVDDTVSKQGKYVPGTTLQIVSRERLYKDQPEYLVILAHNFKDYIISSLRPHYKGKIIVMIPDVRVYE